MKLEGEMVDMIVEVDGKKYLRYVIYEYGNKVIYLKVLKVLYGCTKSGIL